MTAAEARLHVGHSLLRLCDVVRIDVEAAKNEILGLNRFADENELCVRLARVEDALIDLSKFIECLEASK